MNIKAQVLIWNLILSIFLSIEGLSEEARPQLFPKAGEQKQSPSLPNGA